MVWRSSRLPSPVTTRAALLTSMSSPTLVPRSRQTRPFPAVTLLTLVNYSSTRSLSSRLRTPTRTTLTPFLLPIMRMTTSSLLRLRTATPIPSSNTLSLVRWSRMVSLHGLPWVSMPLPAMRLSMLLLLLLLEVLASDTRKSHSGLSLD